MGPIRALPCLLLALKATFALEIQFGTRGGSGSKTICQRIVRDFKPSAYDAPTFATNPHVNTLMGSGDFEEIVGAILRKPSPPLPYERKRLDTPDGDYIDIDFMRPTCAPAACHNDSIVVLLHGLEGSSSAPLVKKFATTLAAEGFHIAAANFRGCSGEPTRTLRQYHLGFTEDLEFLLPVLRRGGGASGGPETVKRIYLVGFSLGGNVILKYLGEQGARALAQGVCGAAVACVPFAPAASVRRMRQGAFESKFYTPVFLNRMKNKAKAVALALGAVAEGEAPPPLPADAAASNAASGAANGAAASAAAAGAKATAVAGAEDVAKGGNSGGGGAGGSKLAAALAASLGGVFKSGGGGGGSGGDGRRSRGETAVKIDLAALEAADSFEAFDEVFTSKVFGFATKEDYYRQVCAKPYLRRIRVPTLVLNALDDPFMDPAAAATPADIADAPVKIKYHQQGGHCGFVLPLGSSDSSSAADGSSGGGGSNSNSGFLPSELTRFVRHCHARQGDVDAAAVAAAALSLLPGPLAAAVERTAAAAGADPLGSISAAAGGLRTAVQQAAAGAGTSVAAIMGFSYPRRGNSAAAVGEKQRNAPPAAATGAAAGV